MAQKIKVQDGIVVYSKPDYVAGDDTTYVDFGIKGNLDVSKYVTVGNTSTDGTISTNYDDIDLTIIATGTGDITLRTDAGGGIKIRDAWWPTNAINPGMFLGANALNVLEFYSFVIGFGTDTETTSSLNISFPNAQPGQMVYGPTVVYLCVAAGLTPGTATWRSLAGGLGYTPVNNNGSGFNGSPPAMTGPLILNANPTASLQAATKQYVDSEIAAVSTGINVHAACQTSTTVALPACNYSNGISGVGATLTAAVNGVLGTVGGYAGLVVTSRILVKNQLVTIQNGIYEVTSLGVNDPGGSPWILTRTADFDGSPASEVEAGDMTYVQEGTLGGTQWVQTNVGTGLLPDHVIIGTDPVIFSQFSGAGTYTAGTGINILVNTISNTGVLSVIAGSGIGVSGATGNVTISNTGPTTLAGLTDTNISSPVIGQLLEWNGTYWVNVTQALTINTQPSDYTLQLTDAYNTLIRITKATSAVVTIPNDSTVNMPIGSAVLIGWNGVGSVSVAGAVGVTVISPDSFTIGKQYGKITAMKTAANYWEIEGNLAP
jgi:hypothetical protein